MNLNFLRLSSAVAAILCMVSCTEVDPETTSAENPVEADFVRLNQMHKRYDCGGEVISEKMETINSLSKRYRIASEDAAHVWGFKATSRYSGDTKGSLWGSLGQFTVDLAPTLLNIQIKPGLNEIRYQFSYCYEVVMEPQTGEKQCAHTLEYSDEKSFWLKANYKLKELQGVREIRPSQEECSNYNAP